MKKTLRFEVEYVLPDHIKTNHAIRRYDLGVDNAFTITDTITWKTYSRITEKIVEKRMSIIKKALEEAGCEVIKVTFAGW